MYNEVERPAQKDLSKCIKRAKLGGGASYSSSYLPPDVRVKSYDSEP